MVRRQDRFQKPPPPQPYDCSGTQERVVIGCEKEAIPARTLTPTRTAETLEEGCYGVGSIDLNHPIEIADINSEFQRASRHDHAVLCLGERLLCGSPFLRAKRAVGKKR